MRLEPLPGERDPGMADARLGAFRSEPERTDDGWSHSVRIWHHLFTRHIHRHEREQRGRQGKRLPGGQASGAIHARSISAGTAQTGLIRARLIKARVASQSVTAAAERRLARAQYLKAY